MVEEVRQEAAGEGDGGQPGARDTEPPPAADEISLIDLLAALGEEKYLLFGLPLVAVVIATIWSLMLPIKFTASTSFLPPQQQQSTATAVLQQLGGLAGVAAGIRRSEDLYIGILRSETLQSALIRRFDLMKRYDATYRSQAREALTANVDIRADSKAGLLRLDATDPDPAFAAALANAHVEELHKLMGSLAVTEAQQRRVYFQQQLEKAKEALVGAEVALRQTQERTGLIALDKQGEAIIRAAADLRAQIASREVQLQAMRTYATPENSEVKRMASEIGELKAQLANMESGQVRGKGDVIVPTGKVPQAGLEYVRALRELKYQEAIFELMARQFELARADEAREGPLVQQIDVAQPPESRSKPRRRQIVLLTGIFAGLIAVALALLRIAARRSLADPDNARRLELLRSSWRVRSRR